VVKRDPADVQVLFAGTMDRDRIGLPGQQGGSQVAGLGVLAEVLRNALEYFFSAQQVKENIAFNISHVDEIDTRYLAQISGEDVKDIEDMAPLQRDSLARTKFFEALKQKDDEIKKLFYIIENALLILWRHLEYYLNPSPFSSHTPVRLPSSTNTSFSTSHMFTPQRAAMSSPTPSSLLRSPTTPFSPSTSLILPTKSNNTSLIAPSTPTQQQQQQPTTPIVTLPRKEVEDLRREVVQQLVQVTYRGGSIFGMIKKLEDYKTPNIIYSTMRRMKELFQMDKDAK
jgi:hypothetical protein